MKLSLGFILLLIACIYAKCLKRPEEGCKCELNECHCHGRANYFFTADVDANVTYTREEKKLDFSILIGKDFPIKKKIDTDKIHDFCVRNYLFNYCVELSHPRIAGPLLDLRMKVTRSVVFVSLQHDAWNLTLVDY